MSPAILAAGVSKSYGSHLVLAGIDLRVQPGEVVCLIGPSGSGKSTLLRCLAFLEQHDEGIIEIGGKPLGFAPGPDGRRVRLPEAEIARVRRGVGMVFQQFNLWPHRTALGNVAEALRFVLRMPRAAAEGRAKSYLDRVGLPDHADHYPSELSGGQQQRVAIARALAMEPAIMLFDEPTSSLDPELTGEVLNVMRGLAADGMTMVIVTHEIGFAAQVAQHIVFLEAGRIALEGTAADVFRRPWNPRLARFLETYLDRGASMLMAEGQEC
ncbi:MAG: amino acid ABC transporter ATP-binding protein [Acetobacteraceae bacterium]|nr:amino acid ABC transporter ATP-binding protein [Acetobacteraceae bacterium]